jgi:hypothetical protein
MTTRELVYLLDTTPETLRVWIERVEGDSLRLDLVDKFEDDGDWFDDRDVFTILAAKDKPDPEGAAREGVREMVTRVIDRHACHLPNSTLWAQIQGDDLFSLRDDLIAAIHARLTEGKVGNS